MALFDRTRQTQPPDSAAEVAPLPGQPALKGTVADLLRRAFSTAAEPPEVRWRFIVEMALVGLGALVISLLFIWATVTDRVSVEALAVMIVVLALTIFTVSHSLSYHARNQALQQSARESVAKTKLAVEIMMDFLRDFTLKNQQAISQVAESQKVRVIEDLRNAVEDLGRSVTDAHLRRELARIEDTIERKIMDIPTGVAFPLPRLEIFDQALRHLEEPERPLKCPACGATQVRLSKIDSREGMQYNCLRCRHEFSVGITLMLEKNS
jgi:uncharacterized protein YoxC